MAGTERDRLLDLLRSEDGIAFVGAGLTNPPGDQWEGLVGRLAVACGVELGAGSGLVDVRKAVDLCLDKNHAAANAFLREEFPLYDVRMRTALSFALQFGFKAVLTTNFCWVDAAADFKRYRTVFSYPGLPLRNGVEQSVYYLHGHFNSELRTADAARLVFGHRSFERAYGASLLPALLLNVLTFEQVVFFSFDPTEEYFERLVRQSLDIRKALEEHRRMFPARPPRFPHPVPTYEHFILWPAPAVGDQQAIFSVERLRSLGITPVLYEKEREDYVGLERYLDSLRNELTADRNKEESEKQAMSAGPWMPGLQEP